MPKNRSGAGAGYSIEGAGGSAIKLSNSNNRPIFNCNSRDSELKATCISRQEGGLTSEDEAVVYLQNRILKSPDLQIALQNCAGTCFLKGLGICSS